ncbi:hypothetical protein [Candidatus Viridilinea mediisalina]|uniref:Uncharacterized protein n=1 Tax=Candidatus Viridilinea mediisalina TaxID=2024553 RepID=A0A2A6RP73_9CHLR|nr:hypothetical protein [Candidatus Viridilinea mediisalina]PDW04701.1 hypothetical protein CJ255_02050 [Candidatus Viridilinea mediisalina]
MEILFELQGFLIGLIGWAASVLMIQNSERLTVNDKRAMAVCMWVFWMMPGIGTLALQGVLTMSTAALYVGITTLALGALVLLGAVGPRTRP